MTALQAPPRSRTSRKIRRKTAKPVPEMLLELAYLMHATRVVGRRPEPARADR